MKRGKPHTAMPILVKVNRDDKLNAETDDWLTFFPDEWDGSLFVRVVGVEQVKEWRKTLRARDQDMLLGVNYLKNWLDSGGRDEYALERAYFRLRPHIPNLEPPPKRIIRTKNATLIFPEQKGLAAVHNYSSILTDLVKRARVVMWYSRELYGRALPAIYCPDKRTAVFASRLIGPIRICAYEGCGAVFIPNAKNKSCCTTAHAANYRQAKCRAMLYGTRPTSPDATTKAIAAH